MTDRTPYVLERSFAAPRELVWRTWTEAAHLMVWYGPGVETVIHELDVTPGGKWLVEMSKGDWRSFQRADYLEVVAPERLVWLQSVSDADWAVATMPQMPDWPRVLHTEVTFTEPGAGRTDLRLVWTPHEATDAEWAAFGTAIQGMGGGWAKGMDVLADHLAKLQTA